MRKLLLTLLLASIGLAGCNGISVPSNAAGTFPKGGALVPATTLALTPSYSITLEKLLYYGGVGAVAYYVVDPLAPNWEIQEAKFPDEKVMLSMKMKRYYVGGSGEARPTFQRRARELVREGGYERFEILEYSEGMDSNAMGSQRVAEGVIALVKRSGASIQPETPPARSTPSSAVNPRS